MTTNIIGFIGILVLLVLVFSRVWIGVAMALVGFLGYAVLDGIDNAFAVLVDVPFTSLANYSITVLPLFMLMGNIVSNTGIGEGLYKTMHKWLGPFPGGLAMGTVGSCALFSATCGSSMATLVTIGKIAMPEMKRYGYSQRLATGSVASGATLGILIPPSMAFILYAILTGQSVGLLFIAGIIPGVILTASFMIAIYLLSKRNPKMGPPGPKTNVWEKIVSLKHSGVVLALVIFVIGGIYMGAFTPNEAGAIGSFGALVITLIGGRLSWGVVKKTFMEAAQTTAMIVVIIIGAMIFVRFLAVSRLPFTISEFVSNLELNRYIVFGFIVLFYIFCGMFMEMIAAVVLTVPIVFPTVTALGFDPIWFGVIVVILMEMALITPPLGMNVFILAGVSKVPVTTIFRGSLPFALLMFAFVILIIFFPQLVLFLPNMMK